MDIFTMCSGLPWATSLRSLPDLCLVYARCITRREKRYILLQAIVFVDIVLGVYILVNSLLICLLVLLNLPVYRYLTLEQLTETLFHGPHMEDSLHWRVLEI